MIAQSFSCKINRVCQLLVFLLFVSGCGVHVEPLMPTPLLYDAEGVGPLDHIPEEEQWTLRKVYYATTRLRDENLQRVSYTNREIDEVSVGVALIGFGGKNMTWEDLSQASSQANRENIVPLSIAGIMEAGGYDFDQNGQITDARGASKWLFSHINESIESSRDKDILVYVHGAKVNFYNACAFAAQLDHFMGRDMTSIAFSWPTRQNIFAYAMGDDLNRAYRAAPALVSLITALAEETPARRIHILSWSAGARLVTAALAQLRAVHPEETPEQVRERYRLGTVYYAAGDVPKDEFVSALPAINDLVQRVVVTASSEDEALRGAKFFMGGVARIGEVSPGELTDAQREIVLKANRLEYIDLSKGREDRGFDITGHRYWFNHPWASSDMVLTIRTDLDPHKRGLEQGEPSLLWWMPEDYPERLKRLYSVPEEELRE